MTNFLFPLTFFMHPETPREKKFVSSYRPDSLLPLIDPNDIGAFAAAAFTNPKQFNEKTITLFSQLKTVDDAIEVLGRLSGQPIEAVYRSDEETDAMIKSNPFVQSQKFGRALSSGLSLDEVKSWGVPLGTFEEYLKREQDLVKKTFDPATPAPEKWF